jgi:prevent-host-death family protein
MTVGVRELKTNLSRYLRQVQRGARIRVTMHGRTIATIQPPEEAAPDRSWAHEMVARGEARWNGGKPAGLANPVRLRPGGKTAAEMVIEDRG